MNIGNNKNTGILILSAGISQRMGKPKFLLNFDNKETFIEQITKKYLKWGAENVVLVVNKYDVEKVNSLNLNGKIKIVTNNFPEKGRFFSVISGIKNFEKDPAVFIHNIDNPFVDYNVLNLLLNNLREKCYCVPVYNEKGGHPVLISSEIAKDIKTQLDYTQNLKEYLKKYKRINLSVNNGEVLFNVNTPADYNNFKRYLQTLFHY